MLKQPDLARSTVTQGIMVRPCVDSPVKGTWEGFGFCGAGPRHAKEDGDYTRQAAIAVPRRCAWQSAVLSCRWLEAL